MYFNEQEASNWKGKLTAFKISVVKNCEGAVELHCDSSIFTLTFSHYSLRQKVHMHGL